MIVTICAIVGAVLGVFNFVKAFKKERKEAKLRADQNLVKALYKPGRTRINRISSDLYVKNNDPRPVTGIHVDLFNETDCNGQPVSFKDWDSLGNDEEVHIRQFGQGSACYKSAKFTYTDADNIEHKYTQDNLRPG